MILLLRLLGCLVLPPRLYNQVVLPVLMYFLRAIPPTFHIFMWPAHRFSRLALRSLFGPYTAFGLGYFFSLLGLWRVNPTLELIYCIWSTMSLMLLCHWYGNVVPGGISSTWQLAARLSLAATTLGAERVLRQWRRADTAVCGGDGDAVTAGKLFGANDVQDRNEEAERQAGAHSASGGETAGLAGGAVGSSGRCSGAERRRDGCLPYVWWRPEGPAPGELWPRSGALRGGPSGGTAAPGAAAAGRTAGLPSAADVVAALVAGAAPQLAAPAPAVEAIRKTEPLSDAGLATSDAALATSDAGLATSDAGLAMPTSTASNDVLTALEADSGLVGPVLALAAAANAAATVATAAAHEDGSR